MISSIFAKVNAVSWTVEVALGMACSGLGKGRADFFRRFFGVEHGDLGFFCGAIGGPTATKSDSSSEMKMLGDSGSLCEVFSEFLFKDLLVFPLSLLIRSAN